MLLHSKRMTKNYYIYLFWRLPFNTKFCLAVVLGTAGDGEGEQNSIPAFMEFAVFEEGRAETFFECLLGTSPSAYIM